MHLDKVNSSFSETYMYVFFKYAYSVEKKPLNFRNASVSTLFQKFVNSNYKRMKRNLRIRKKHIL